MKKKYFILAFLIFILCGCKANVDITISGDDLNETITIYDYASQDKSKEQVLAAYRKYVSVDYNEVIVDTEPDEKVDGVSYYDRELTDLGNGYQIKYKYTYKVNDYVKSKSVKNAFKSAFIQKDDVEKEIRLTTDNSGIMLFKQYPYLDEIKININTTYPVLEHNADSVSGNVYTWNYNRNNHNKSIFMKLKTGDKEEAKPVKEEEKKEGKKKLEVKHAEENEFQKYVWLFVVLGIGVVLLMVLVGSKISHSKYK